MAISTIIAASTSGVLAVVGLITAVIKLREECQRLRKTLRRKVVIVGVVGAEPNALSRVPEFTDYNRAATSDAPLVLLYCRTLSYALRHCDYVSYDEDSPFRDPKIRKPQDDFWSTLTV